LEGEDEQTKPAIIEMTRKPRTQTEGTRRSEPTLAKRERERRGKKSWSVSLSRSIEGEEGERKEEPRGGKR
jgi:hypothetical protein